MTKIYVSDKDIKDFRDLFGTDYSGQEKTQDYMKAVHKWKKKQEKAILKWKQKQNKETTINRLIKWIQKLNEGDNKNEKK